MMKHIRSRRFVRDRDAGERIAVTVSPAFEVEPHDVFARGVFDDLRALEDTALGDRTRRIVGDGERDAVVFPIPQVFRRVDVDTDLRVVAGIAADLVFAEPIIDAVVEQDTAAVGVDVDALVVLPNLARSENGRGFGRGGVDGGNGKRRDGDQGKQACHAPG